ncbi:alpha/beta fold hydrolase [Rhizobium hidalgonense]|uniref:alpha/beta fold hydrolase n=1 Tax=Rhizobium hidalgonense TaxID=1538159 RepID=UPI000FEC220D|nr:alpha/beta hydrolase [Rhizobium hidalgonense]RWX19309.1 alpha/beta fold hydrolase [Rhizobium hidalgonense]
MRRAEPFETRDGTILNVDMAGEGASVIFQHGLCGDAAQTDEVFPLDAGFRRVTIEARGHGHSQAGNLEQLSIATFCDDIAAYIEKNLAAPIVIGGISMGAAIALRLSVKRPDLIKALIIARPAWLAASAPENMAPNADVGGLLKILPPDEAKQVFLAGSVGVRLAAEAPDNLASLAGFFSRTPLDVTAELLTRISNDGPGVTDADICNLALPTLVIGHERDSIHPLGHARALAARIAGARFVQITPKAESRPHYVADFRLAVGNFLKEL